MPDTVLILAGGEAPRTDILTALPPAALCVAADSGIDHALALGLVPAFAVGDFDSVSAEGLAAAERAGTTIERHPMAKDETDLELALRLAVELVPARVVVAGIGGGRADHLLANLLALADRRYAGPEVEGVVGTALISVVHDHRRLAGEVGELVSLLPVHGDAREVTTTGLAFPLGGETLRAGSGRGVSNVFAEASASVLVGDGSLLAVQPYRFAISPAGASSASASPPPPPGAGQPATGDGPW
jgi:thiamine pyrophosphokinase